MMPSSMRLLHDGCECWTILPKEIGGESNSVQLTVRPSKQAVIGEGTHRLWAYLKLNQMKARAMPQPAKLSETMEA